jgi:hypothetical protein
MRVKMKTVSAGPNPEDHAAIGQIVDVHHERARALVDAGHADAIDEFPSAESSKTGDAAGQQSLLGEGDKAGADQATGKARGKAAKETASKGPDENTAA